MAPRATPLLCLLWLAACREVNPRYRLGAAPQPDAGASRDAEAGDAPVHDGGDLLSDGAIRTGDRFAASDGTSPAGTLIGYWPFDETSGEIAADRSGQGNHARLVKPAAAWTAGRVGGAFRLSGETHFVVPASPSLDQAAGSFTIALWVRKRATPQVIDTIVSRTSPNGGYGLTFWSERFSLGFGSAVSRNVQVPSIAPPDVWLHVAAVVSGPTATLYLDGKESSRGSTAGHNVLAPGADLAIGAFLDAGVAQFRISGDIDELRLYRAALSAAEIAALAR